MLFVVLVSGWRVTAQDLFRGQMLVDTPEVRRYFYDGFTYGSQSLFDPLRVLLNRGYEMSRITKERSYYSPVIPSYKINNIIENLSHPVKYVRMYGPWDFMREQVIPFGNIDKLYWWPNYTLHLIGGGITYTALQEWSRAHHVKYPRVIAASTIITAALINESVEEKIRAEGFRLNVDAVADFWLFDLGGMFLFEFSPGVNRFFSQTLHARDWSKQPAVLLPGVNLANCGQFIAMKWKVPKVPKLSLFSLVGLGGLGGLSYNIDAERSISVGIGSGPQKKNKDLFGLPIDVSLVPMMGIYLDRNNSLLASLELSASYNDLYHNYFSELNIYPGLFRYKSIDPSLWMAVAQDGYVLMGLGCRYTYGYGIGVY